MGCACRGLGTIGAKDDGIALGSGAGTGAIAGGGMLATDIGSGGKAVTSKRDAGTGLALSFALEEAVDARERFAVWAGCTDSVLNVWARSA